MESQPLKLTYGPYHFSDTFGNGKAKLHLHGDLVEVRLTLETPQLPASAEATTLEVYMSVRAAKNLSDDLSKIVDALEKLQASKNAR